MNKALVVIDMQNDFVSGSLGSPHAMDIVANIKNKTDAAVNNGDVIFFTRDTHEKNYLETREGKNLPVPHCIRGTWGHEIIAELLPLAEGKKIIDKPAFGSLLLAEALAEGGFDEIELVGLCTDICVVSNALIIKARLPEAKISVDPDCTAGITEESRAAALLVMKMCQVD
ncbi:MAG: cysteine hydrolase [Defluviitaleaceae bacterium]|nr:cysteine hydrolase [Defluviitaleaceae bacterium]